MRCDAGTPVVVAIENVEVRKGGSFQHQVLEYFVVGCFVESQTCHVVHIIYKLRWTPMAKLLVGSLTFDLVHLGQKFLSVLQLDPLPRQPPIEKVDDNIANRDQIVPARLLILLMGSDRHVAARTKHLLHCHERNVLVRLRVNYRACQPEIDQMWHAAFLA